MLLPVVAALLAIGAAQSGGSPGGGVGDEAAQGAPEAAQTASPALAGPTATDASSFVGPPGVPFIPQVGARPPEERGIFLDAALLSELRTLSLQASDASTTWGTQLEITPGFAFELFSPRFDLSVGYAPRLAMPFNVGGFELAVLNRATLNATWRADAVWTFSALGLFVVGDYSQLIPASTPGGAGPTPPVFNPVRSFQVFPYVGIDTQLRAEAVLSPRARLRISGGYFDVGGLGTEGEANQPRAWGPQGEAAFSWLSSRTTAWTTTATAQDWIMSGQDYVAIATLTEGWTQAWSSSVATTVALGAGMATRDVETALAMNHAVPVAKISLNCAWESRQPLHLTIDAALAPYYDTYLRIPYQRVTIGASMDWRPSDAWLLGASLSGALTPYTTLAPESYGTAGLSASYAPVKAVVLSAGAFSQAQFQGQYVGVGTFLQWTFYFSLTLRDRLGL